MKRACLKREILLKFLTGTIARRPTSTPRFALHDLQVKLEVVSDAPDRYRAAHVHHSNRPPRLPPCDTARRAEPSKPEDNRAAAAADHLRSVDGIRPGRILFVPMKASIR